MTPGELFLDVRNRLLAGEHAGPDGLGWSDVEHFNWAHDYFDLIATGNQRAALRLIDDAGRDESISFMEMARRSHGVANFLKHCGVQPGDRILLMLGNVVELWESMLGIIRLGAVMIPATTLLQRADLQDRITRGGVKAVIADSAVAARFESIEGAPIRISVGEPVSGWIPFSSSTNTSVVFTPDAPTRADDLMLLYFTSGTTARPKLVAHTHQSYPVGHLSTARWIGLAQGDLHLNLSSPGWAKHAWSSFFAPWNAGATILAYQYERFLPSRLLQQMVRTGVTTFCAPPTVWRMLLQEALERWPVTLRHAVSAGEPLNPEVIDSVQRAWGITVRDGFGQTESTAQVGNLPGEAIKPGSMGRPLPGYSVVLLDPDGTPAEEGELCLDLTRRPVGLMQGYLDDPQQTATVMRDGYYHSGDIARRDTDGFLTYVGRADDVFKSSDYRISPFELESVLIEHPAVLEAAVVPSPDPLRLSVPKAFVVLVDGISPCAEVATSILRHVQERVSPFKRIRRIEFAPLPKTISGKIRRVDLRAAEVTRVPGVARRPLEFWEDDLPTLRSAC
jgi:acetyl-CoA synthetase